MSRAKQQGRARAEEQREARLRVPPELEELASFLTQLLTPRGIAAEAVAILRDWAREGKRDTLVELHGYVAGIVAPLYDRVYTSEKEVETREGVARVKYWWCRAIAVKDGERVDIYLSVKNDEELANRLVALVEGGGGRPFFVVGRWSRRVGERLLLSDVMSLDEVAKYLVESPS